MEDRLDSALQPQLQAHRTSFGGRQAACGSTLPPSPYSQKFKSDLRIGSYAKDKINAWITKDKHFEADGLSGDLNILVWMERWTATAADCLDIKDLRNIATVEADDLALKDAGPDSDSDPNSADGAE
jgi:hypothetical protein